jgi:hypothetical protein
LEVCYNKELVHEYLGNNTASIPEKLVRTPPLTEKYLKTVSLYLIPQITLMKNDLMPKQ